MGCRLVGSPMDRPSLRHCGCDDSASDSRRVFWGFCADAELFWLVRMSTLLRCLAVVPGQNPCYYMALLGRSISREQLH
ncbi:hypothetical protein GQ607_005547 [Colletotrichum asianum]|uniref:Uncharacterized protein n=1 Tax=Colletotrichum asianum TaxID=702518 RepID=A0A8H3WG20_9PEZI|nr:hypothetical protein GQ607_005547 [Colletotrichum asianum]